jgi:hypothetical protein
LRRMDYSLDITGNRHDDAGPGRHGVGSREMGRRSLETWTSAVRLKEREVRGNQECTITK